MQAEYKYTDRDVREIENAVEIATDYIENYTGEFQFLIDCKMRVAQGMDLPIGMVRGIFNCMRVDPRVKNLPEPMPFEEVKVENVVPIKRKKKVMWGPHECDRTDFHERHQIGDKDLFRYRSTCQGVYEINRKDFSLDATITSHRPNLLARKGGLVHRHNGEAWFIWRVYPHEYGYSRDPYLYVRTACTFPRMIENPLVLTEDQANLAVADCTVVPGRISRHPIEFCKRCFPELYNSTQEGTTIS